jgi:hypothetical protein
MRITIFIVYWVVVIVVIVQIIQTVEENFNCIVMIRMLRMHLDSKGMVVVSGGCFRQRYKTLIIFY